MLRFEFPPLTMSRMTVVPLPLNGFDCAICCDPLTSRPASVLPCLHKFHTLCVNRWIATNPVCPECRNPTTFACELSFFQSVGASSPKCCHFEYATDRDTQGGRWPWISQAGPRRDCMRLLLDLLVEGDCRVFLLFGYSRERAFLCGSAVRCGVSHAARVCFVVGVRNQWRF